MQYLRSTEAVTAHGEGGAKGERENVEGKEGTNGERTTWKEGTGHHGRNETLKRKEGRGKEERPPNFTRAVYQTP